MMADPGEEEFTAERELRERRQEAEDCSKQGDKYLAEKKYRKALACYSEGMSYDPGNCLLPASRAHAFFEYERYEAAETDSTLAIMLNPNCCIAFIRRGKARIALGKYQIAQKDFEMVIKMEPYNEEAQRGLRVIQARLSRSPECPDKETGNVSERRMPRPPESGCLAKHDPRSWDKFGDKECAGIEMMPWRTIQELAGKELDEESEIRHRKERAETCLEQGDEYLESGDLDSAERCYENGVALDPTDWRLALGRAEARLKNSDWLNERAERIATTAVMLNAASPRAYMVRGKIRLKLRQFHRSGSDFDRVLELEPHNLLALRHLRTVDEEIEMPPAKKSRQRHDFEEVDESDAESADWLDSPHSESVTEEIRHIAEAIKSDVHRADFKGTAKYLSHIVPLYKELCGIRDEIIMKVDFICEKIEKNEILDKERILKKLETAFAFGRLKGSESSERNDDFRWYTYSESPFRTSASCSPVNAAAERGEVGEVTELLMGGHEVDERGKHLAESPLCNAVKSGNISLIKHLIQHGADVNHADYTGRTPLHYLTSDDTQKQGHAAVEVAEMLIESGAVLSLQDDYGHTPVWYAAKNGHVDCLEYFLPLIPTDSRGPSLPDNFRAKSFVDMLQGSLKYCHSQTEELLFDAIQDPTSPVHVAFYGKSVDTSCTDVCKISIKGTRLLDYVIICEYGELALGLLRRYPQLASAKDARGETSLFTAVREHKVRMTYTLMGTSTEDSQPLFDPREPNNAGKSCVDLAQAFDDVDMTAALYVVEPPPDMSRGAWMRSWYTNGRNIISVCHDFELAQSKEQDFTFAPLELVSDMEDQRHTQGSDCYKFHLREGRTIGKAVIIYNMNFHDKPGKKRRGADVDMQRLSRLFLSLGLDVQVWKDLTASEMKERISTIKQNDRLEYDDVFVLIMMSHGGRGHVSGVDREPVYMDEDIISQFDGNHCPALRGKPKLFIVQACRGGRTDGNGYVDADDEDDAEVTVDAFSDEVWAAPTRVHPKADMLIIFSTYEDHVAMHHPKNGSWFLEEFVLMCELFCHEDHLVDIVNKANDLLSKRLSYNTGGVQVAETRSSLRKKLYLFRTLDDDTIYGLLEHMRDKWWLGWD